MYQMYRGVSNYNISPCTRIFRLARGVRMQSLWRNGYGHGPPERCVIWQFDSTRLVPPELGCISCISGTTLPSLQSTPPPPLLPPPPPMCVHAHHEGTRFDFLPLKDLKTHDHVSWRWQMKTCLYLWGEGSTGCSYIHSAGFFSPGCLTPCMYLLYTDSCRANLPESFLVDRSRRYFLCVCICIYECMHVCVRIRGAKSWWGQEFPFCSLKTKHIQNENHLVWAFRAFASKVHSRLLGLPSVCRDWHGTRSPTDGATHRSLPRDLWVREESASIHTKVAAPLWRESLEKIYFHLSSFIVVCCVFTLNALARA